MMYDRLPVNVGSKFEMNLYRFEFLCLSCVYAAMCFYALYRLAQIHSRVQKKWTFQKKTMALVAACAIARATLFAVTGFEKDRQELISPLHTDFDQDWSYLLSTAPSLFFVSVYCLLVGFWSQLACEDPQSVRRFMRFTILMTWIFYGTYLVAVELSDHDRDRLHTVPDTYFATLNAFLSCAVLYFGMRVQRLLESVPIDRELRFNKLNELIVLTVICTIAFIVRSIVAIVVGSSSTSVLSKTSWYLFAVAYYGFLEILPLMTMLWYLRNLPPREQQITFDIVLGSDPDNNSTYSNSNDDGGVLLDGDAKSYVSFDEDLP